MPIDPKKPLIPYEAPTYPFQQVAADYFKVNNNSYLVYISQYSAWATTYYFPPGSSTSAELIKVFRAEFRKHVFQRRCPAMGGRT